MTSQTDDAVSIVNITTPSTPIKASVSEFNISKSKYSIINVCLGGSHGFVMSMITALEITLRLPYQTHDAAYGGGKPYTVENGPPLLRL